jgi:hypothetical protein
VILLHELEPAQSRQILSVDCGPAPGLGWREAKLCYLGRATMENWHGLAVAGMVTQANGTAERPASEIMLKAKSKGARGAAKMSMNWIVT